MSQIETMKVMPTHESQGDYVVINKADFDSEKHEPYNTLDTDGDGVVEKAELWAALDAKGIKYKKTLGIAKLKELLDGK